MKRAKRGLAETALLGALLWLAACSEWKMYHHPETDFSVEFPGTPSEASKTDATAFGVIDTYTIQFGFPDDRLRYQVRADVYPAQVLALGGSGSLIGARQKRHEYEIKGKTIEEDDIELAGNAGKAYTFEFPDGTLEQARVFLVDGRMFQVSAISPSADRDRAELARFLDSFRLPAAPEVPSPAAPDPDSESP